MKGKWIFVVFALVVVLLAVFFILQANSMTLALRSNDLKTDACYIEQPYMDDGICYAILQTYTDDGTLALVQAKKNVIGFWTVSKVMTNQKYVSLTWLKVHDASQRTDYKLESDGRHEWHYVCCGNDATGIIELSNQMLPENTTVSIRQTGQEYTVHIISFDNAGLGDFSLRQILLDNGFVSG